VPALRFSFGFTTELLRAGGTQQERFSLTVATTHLPVLLLFLADTARHSVDVRWCMVWIVHSWADGQVVWWRTLRRRVFGLPGFVLAQYYLTITDIPPFTFSFCVVYIDSFAFGLRRYLYAFVASVWRCGILMLRCSSVICLYC